MKNLNRRRTVLITMLSAVCLMVAAAPQHPMRFEAFTPCSGNGSLCAPKILASGEIEANSAKNLATFLAKPPKNSFLPPTPTIIFDSPGGSVAGGIALGRFIRSRGLDTMLSQEVSEELRDAAAPEGYTTRVLAKDTRCLSACTLAFIGGVARVVEAGTKFGVHQFYSSKGAIGDSETQNTMTYLAGYVESMGVSRGMLDLGSTARPDQMYWIPIAMVRELRIDNMQPALTPWRIDADEHGVPSLAVHQQVGPNRDLYLVMSNATDKAAVATISVLVVVQRDAPGQSRHDTYPVGDAPNISIKIDGKPAITLQPRTNWRRAKTNTDGSVSFISSVVVTRTNLQAIAGALKLSIDDNFSNVVRDMSLATDLSTTNLAGGINLLLRTR